MHFTLWLLFTAHCVYAFKAYFDKNIKNVNIGIMKSTQNISIRHM